MKFLYVGDPHERMSQPMNRLDDFRETYDKKVAEIKKIALKHKVKAILQPGDFLDKDKFDTRFLMEVVDRWSFVPVYDLIAELQWHPEKKDDIIKRLKGGIPYIGLQGNHELPGNSLDAYPKSSLAFLEKIHFMTMAKKDEPIVFTDDDGTTVAITGAPYHLGMDTDKHTDDYIVAKKMAEFHIHMAHGYLTDQNFKDLFDHTILDKVAPFTQADLTIAGHDHIGFPLTNVDGKQFINPGSMTRTKNDLKEIGRKVKVLLIEVTKENGVVVTEIPLKSAPKGKEVLDRTVIEAKQNYTTKMESIRSIVNKAQVRQGQSITEIINAVSEAKGLDESVTKEAVALVTDKMDAFEGETEKAYPDYTISQVVLENFQSHAKTVLNLSEGLNVFYGESSNGKTAILRAMRWLFADKGTSKNFVKQGASYAKVSVTLDNGTTIARKFETKSGGINTYSVYNPITGETTEQKLSYLPEIQKILGYKNILFDVKKLTNTGNEVRKSVDINFLNQGEGWFFIGEKLSAPDRAKVIGSIFGTHYTDSVIREMEAQLTSERQDLKRSKDENQKTKAAITELAYIDGVKTTLEKAKMMRASIEQKQRLLEKVRTLSEKAEKIQVEMNRLDGIVMNLKDLPDWKATLQRVQFRQQQFLTMQRLSIRAEQIETNITQAKRVEDSLVHLDDWRNRLSDIHEKRQAEESLREKLNQHQLIAQRKENFRKQITHFTNVSTALENLDAAKAIYDEAQTKIKRLEKAKDIDRIRETLRQEGAQTRSRLTETGKQKDALVEEYQSILKHAGTCPTCHGHIDDTSIERIVASYEHEG